MVHHNLNWKDTRSHKGEELCKVTTKICRQQGPAATPQRVWWTAAEDVVPGFAPRGQGEVSGYIGSDVRVPRWLPGKPAEGHALHACLMRTSTSWGLGLAHRTARQVRAVGEAGTGPAGDVQGMCRGQEHSRLERPDH